MENKRPLIIVGIGVLFAAFTPQTLFAYSVPAHQRLTETVFVQYEQVFGDVFTDAEVANAVRGSAEEDELPRPQNHFYDPVHQRGLADGGLSGILSKLWAVDTRAQANYCALKLSKWLGVLCKDRLSVADTFFSSPSDYSWDRAVFEYVHGDKERAMEALGHILHLMEDAAVPAHTRNDAHTFGEPYEEYTQGQQVRVAVRALDIPQFTTLGAYFDSLARFTNEHFLSEDTIFKGYKYPTRSEVLLERALQEGTDMYFGVSDFGKLVRIKSIRNWGKDIREEEYSLDDSQNLINNDYWQTLSREAVTHGVGVVDLFLRAVAQEEKTGALAAKNVSELKREVARQAQAGFALAKSLYGSSLSVADVAELNGAGQVASAAVVGGFAREPVAPASGSVGDTSDVVQAGPQSEPQVLAVSDSVVDSVVPQASAALPSAPVVVDPTPSAAPTAPVQESYTAPNPFDGGPAYGAGGLGGGGGVVFSAGSGGSADTTAPEAPVVTVPISPASTSTTAVVVGGTAEPGSTVVATYRTAGGSDTARVSAAGGVWSFNLTLLEGANTLAFIAIDDAGNMSPEATLSLNVNLAPDAPTVVAPVQGAAVATTSITAYGTTGAGYLVTLSYGANQATTTAGGDGAWSFALSLPEGETTLSFIATDTEGRSSPTTERTITVDITAPSAPSGLTLDACAYSLATTTCLLTSTTAVAQWDSIADAAYYKLSVNGVDVGTTSVASMPVTLVANATTTIALVAYDAAGNVSADTNMHVVHRAQPLIINEVGWAGTDTDANDQWIEIKNLSEYDLDLSHVAVVAADGGPYVQLAGMVRTNRAQPWHTDWPLFVLERAQGAHDELMYEQRSAFEALAVSGEELLLVHEHGSATTTLDRTPAVATCGGWCAGAQDSFISHSPSVVASTTAHRSMERIAGASDGSLAASWQSNDAYLTSSGPYYTGPGKIYATPHAENSTGMAASGFSCTSHTQSVQPGEAYYPGSGSVSCRVFARVFGPETVGGVIVKKGGGIFYGTVGNATLVAPIGVISGYYKDFDITIPAPSATSTEYFTVVWVTRNGLAAADTTAFTEYFTESATTSVSAPHGDYVVVPWAYQAP